MKTLWTILSIVAIANVLAIAGFLGWLSATDRLDRARIERARVLFASTLTAEHAAKADEEATLKKVSEEQEQSRKMSIPPESATSLIARQEQAEMLAVQRIVRLQTELQQLRDTLAKERTAVAAEAERLAADRKAFDDARERMRKEESSAQFKKALATLEGQKPKDAKAMLESLNASGKPDQAVAYLSAMDESVRNAVMAEFTKTDPAMAADLLEKLRSRSIAAAARP